MLPNDLIAAWDNRADELQPYAGAAAEAFRRAAQELRDALDEADEERLSPEQIEAAGVCTAETVRRKVRAGEIENVGSPRRIRVRRGDLPKLPTGRAQRSGRGADAPASFGKVARRAALTASRRGNS